MNIVDTNSTTPQKNSLKLISRERMASGILLSAFVIFLILFFGIPFSIWWYMDTASTPQLAEG